ncbi:MAG: hypothetical protein N2D54_08210, partial [Chloroflexota bacterium]
SPVQVNAYEPWTFNQDDADILVDHIYTVITEIYLPQDGGTQTQETHVGLIPGGEISWLTDCGDLLP